ncbi:MAG TPA: exo-alpha-sialidase [Thermoanaerobaculia bacterium]|jgi:hypothetical protein|nr:exo-alpha-sialidase [Thermoanaerobaculia bacterium]
MKLTLLLLLAAVLPKAKVPFIAADGQGGFYVSHVTDGTFQLTRFVDGKGSPPLPIASGNLVVNGADFPSIAVDGEIVRASWSIRNGHGSMILFAQSNDRGKSWSKPVVPHPELESEFGFVSLLPKDAVFLDGRELPGGVEGAGDMQLRSVDALLDARVCDCCQTAATMTSAGPVVAYRDRSEKEVRDISIVRRTRKGWTEPKTLHADGWQIHGCPVNGPQLDGRGKRVVAAWFTGAQDDPRVQVAFSNDAGATFGAPVRVTEGPTTGRVDVAWLDDRNAVVTYVAGGVLHARRVSRNGKLGVPLRVGKAGGFPRVAVSKENVGVVWTADDGVHLEVLEGVK